MEQTTVDTLTGVVGTLGFPIAVTWFLLTKGSQLVANITQAINDMKVAINDMNGAITKLGERLEQLERERNK